jgi:hypothetical protein
VLLSIFNLEPTEWSTILCEGDLALKLNTKSFEAVKIDLLASSDINVFCRCVAGEAVAMEDGDAVGIAGGLILLQYIFQKGRSVGATVGIGKLQRIRDRIVEENIYVSLAASSWLSRGNRKVLGGDVQYSSSLDVKPYSVHLSAVHCAILMVSTMAYQLGISHQYPSTRSDRPNVGHELQFVSVRFVSSVKSNTVVV